MQLSDARSIRWERVSDHREGLIEFKRLFTLYPGTPRSAEFSLVRLAGYHTPRHRHNYDQIRYQLRGTLNYGKGTDLAEGDVGFFPEGVPYGPQDVPGPAVSLALQFGGPSEQGLITYDQLSRAQADLARSGRFAGGVYRSTAADGRMVNVDGYQAAWEHAAGRPMSYAAPIVRQPVVYATGAHRWRALPGSTGVARRWIGSVSDTRVEVAFLRWDPGAATGVGGDGAGRLLYVLAGALTLDGAAAGSHTAALLEPGEQATAVATAPTEALWIRMPTFDPVVDAVPLAPGVEEDVAALGDWRAVADPAVVR